MLLSRAAEIGVVVVVMVVMILFPTASAAVEEKAQQQYYKNAYATMMYMGTPRDYEFYIATRVMMRSLIRLHVQADLVVIASIDVPLHWVRSM